MRTRIFRAFLLSGFLLFAATLLSLDVFALRYFGARSSLEWRLLGISLLGIVLALALTYFFLRSFSMRMRKLQAYVEALPNAPVNAELPTGDDELGALAASLRRSAPHIQDLLDRLKLENARREAILVSMGEGVLAVDGELRVIFCNDSFARAAGVRTPVVEGTPLLQLVRDPALLEIVASVLKTGQQVNTRLQLRAVRAHSFEVQATPLAGPAARGAMAILHDVTEMERLERIRRDFVAKVSH